MGNCIRSIDPDNGKALLDIAGIDSNLRPEQLSVKDWCLLANVYKHSTFYQPKDGAVKHISYDEE